MATFDTPETGKFSIPDDELDPGLRAQKQSTKDDDKEERGRVNRGNSTDVEDYGMEAEAGRQQEQADRDERRKEEGAQRVADARRAAEGREEERQEGTSQPEPPQSREERETAAWDLARPDREGAAERRGEGETESQAGEEKSGSGQENQELVDALAEGNNAIIGELGQLLQAVNEVTAAIREGIMVKL